MLRTTLTTAQCESDPPANDPPAKDPPVKEAHSLSRTPSERVLKSVLHFLKEDSLSPNTKNAVSASMKPKHQRINC